MKFAEVCIDVMRHVLFPYKTLQSASGHIRAHPIIYSTLSNTCSFFLYFFFVFGLAWLWSLNLPLLPFLKLTDRGSQDCTLHYQPSKNIRCLAASAWVQNDEGSQNTIKLPT